MFMSAKISTNKSKMKDIEALDEQEQELHQQMKSDAEQAEDTRKKLLAILAGDIDPDKLEEQEREKEKQRQKDLEIQKQKEAEEEANRLKEEEELQLQLQQQAEEKKEMEAAEGHPETHSHQKHRKHKHKKHHAKKREEVIPEPKPEDSIKTVVETIASESTTTSLNEK